jgi:hypothetical protein
MVLVIGMWISCSSKDGEDVMERERKRKEAVCVRDF